MHYMSFIVSVPTGKQVGGGTLANKGKISLCIQHRSNPKICSGDTEGFWNLLLELRSLKLTSLQEEAAPTKDEIEAVT